MENIIFFNNKEAFSDWLEAHSEASELWVGYYRKSTGRANFTWSDSVDVALCFGWTKNTNTEKEIKKMG